MRKCLEWDTGDGYPTMWMYLMTLNCTLGNGEISLCYVNSTLIFLRRRSDWKMATTTYNVHYSCVPRFHLPPSPSTTLTNGCAQINHRECHHLLPYKVTSVSWWSSFTGYSRIRRKQNIQQSKASPCLSVAFRPLLIILRDDRTQWFLSPARSLVKN